MPANKKLSRSMTRAAKNGATMAHDGQTLLLYMSPEKGEL